MSTLLYEATNETKRFDNVVDETWDDPSLTTEFPIDGRSPVGEHIQEQQLKGTLSLLVTETPFLNNLGSEAFFTLSGQPRAYEAWQWLKARRYDGTFQYDSVRFGPISNLAIKNVSWEVTAVGKTVFAIDVVQYSFAYSESVLLPPERVRRPSQVPPIDEGAKTTSEGGGENTVKPISVLKRNLGSMSAASSQFSSITFGGL